jgi:signal transduction histidine kinase
MKSTVEQLMRIEEQLSGMLALEVTADVIRNLFAQTDPEDWLTQDMDTLKTTLGHDFMQARLAVEPDENLLEEVALDLENQARVSGISPDACRNALMRLRELHNVHVKQILQDYESYVAAVGRERNLPHPVFVVLGSDAVLDGKQYRAFFRVLIHIFYNIAAHAIEAPEERAAMGKPMQARIECRVEAQQEHILIDIADDGCGIDPEQIRGEMQINEGMTREQTAAVDERELCQYVFEPGYSPALRADSRSSRGIGLFAVAQVVRQLGGSVSVQSKMGIFTRFSFVLRVRQQTVKPAGKNQYGIAVPAEEDTGRTDGGA